MADGDTDLDFLGYVELHCDTELALFSSNDCHRLLRLAGVQDDLHPPMSERGFYGMHRYDISGLLKTAWDRLHAEEFAKSGTNCLGAGV